MVANRWRIISKQKEYLPMLAQCSIPVPRENFGNQSFPNVFSGYRNGVSGKNGLIDVQ